MAKNEAQVKAPEGKAETKKHNMLSVNVRADRKPTLDALKALSEKLNARLTDLVWDALARYVATPPTVAPAGSSASTGTSTGYWVVHELDANQKIKSIFLVDGVRSATKGRLFVRYEADNAKGKSRAFRKAFQAAAYDAQIAGIDLRKTGVEVRDTTGKVLSVSGKQAQA